MRVDLASGLLDLDLGELRRAGGGVERLTDTERRLLRHLAERRGTAVGRDELQQAVWGYRPGILSRTVFTTVGRVRAKIELDPASPRHLVTVAGEGYALVTEGGGSRPARGGGLPFATTPFVGRERELAELEGLIGGGARLVSILGPGGAGKTRLAVELARRHAGGAVFVGLEGITDVERVPAAVAAALGELLAGGPDAWGELVDRVGEGALLCVLDNAEHLGGLGERLPPWLQACPGLSLVVTSRVRLGVRPEAAWALPPLGLPRSGAELSASEAGALLLGNAERARPGFRPSPEELERLAELCARVGGHPLALELAAAWLRLLEPGELLVELDRGEGLHALDSDVPPRHRSLDEVLAASWRLLAPAASRVLEALSVLAEPFDRATAAEVAGADLPTLGHLVDASVLQRVGARFELHPLVRAEARRRLSHDAGRGAALGERHARLFLGRLSRTIHELEAAERPPAGCVAALARDHGDLLGAWANRAAAGDAPALAAAAHPLYRYLDLTNRLPELLAAFRAGCAALEAAPAGSFAAVTCAALAILSSGAGGAADAPLDLGAPAFEELPAALRGDALVHAAIRALHAGELEASVGLTTRAETLARTDAVPYLPVFALAVRGSARLRLGQLDAARADLERAMLASVERRGFGRALVHLGEVELFAGRPPLAREHLEASLRACRESDDRSFLALALCRLGQALERLGEDASAVRVEAIAEGVSSRLPRVWWATALADLGARWVGSGEPHLARDGVVLLAAATAGPLMDPPSRAVAALKEAKPTVGHGAWHEACREGRFANDAALLALAQRDRG